MLVSAKSGSQIIPPNIVCSTYLHTFQVKFVSSCNVIVIQVVIGIGIVDAMRVLILMVFDPNSAQP